MATIQRPERMFGASIKRREDPRLITGKGVYTDDIKLPGTVHAAFVRSPYAHANIRGVNASAAKQMPGVHAVFTGNDLADSGVNAIPAGWLLPDIKLTDRRPIAVDKVRYVGEAVAVVIADSPYLAKDAAERVEVDYEELPVVTDAAIKGAAKVVKQRLVNQRLIPMAIEPRSALATYNPATDEYTLYVTSQNPHVHRLIMAAFVLGIPENKFRVVAPDVGGGFGSKIFIYPEECVVTWATKQLGRPVKWTAERRESFMTDAHGRDHVTDVEMAFDADGKLLGLRVHTIANLGAHLSLFAPSIPTYLYGTLLNGVYQ